MLIEVDLYDLETLIKDLGHENYELLADWVYECHRSYNCNVNRLLANADYVCFDSNSEAITYLEENNLINGENCSVYNCIYGTVIDLEY